MKMKFVLVLTILLCLIILPACSGDGISLSVKKDGVDINTKDSSLKTSKDGIDINTEDQGNSKSDINSILTPKGAVIAERSYGHLFLKSNQSYENLVDFYTKAVRELGATETILLESDKTMEWGYGGLYNGADETPLVIMLTPWEDGFRVLIAYDTGSFTAYDLPDGSIFEGRSLRAK